MLDRHSEQQGLCGLLISLFVQWLALVYFYQQRLPRGLYNIALWKLSLSGRLCSLCHLASTGGLPGSCRAGLKHYGHDAKMWSYLNSPNPKCNKAFVSSSRTIYRSLLISTAPGASFDLIPIQSLCCKVWNSIDTHLRGIATDLLMKNLPLALLEMNMPST